MTRIEFLNRGNTRGFASQVNLFPVPVLVFEWPEAVYWRDELIEAVKARQARSVGLHITNMGGWHSHTDLAEWPEAGARAFVRWAAAMASRATADWRSAAGVIPPKVWRTTAWANVNPPGGPHNRAHHHVIRNWHWSASYYLQMPALADDCEKRGEIVFEDRHIGLDPGSSAATGRRTFGYLPSEGELIMFPSWLYHRVDAHDGYGDRISLAMNFHSEWLERSRYWRHRKNFGWRKLPWLMRPLARLTGKWDQSDPGGPPGTDITPEPTYL